EPVRATLDRATYQRLEVIAGLQLDRLDATLPSLLGELEAFGLPATRARIIEQHRSARRLGVRQIHVDCEGGTRCRQRHQEAYHNQQIDEPLPTRDDEDDGADERDASDDHSHYARNAPP